MATNVFLAANATFTAADNGLKIVGKNAGNEVLRIANGVTGVETDANIERVELAGAIADYKFAILADKGLVITNAAGGVIATIPSLNQNATVAFSDGSAALVQTGKTAATLGTVALTATAATVSTTLDTADKSTVTGSTGGGTPTTGQSFSLTTGTTDAPALTSGNDTITGAAGTFQSTDRLLDTSINDQDILNAVNNSATVNTQIINVETLNITGEYTATGFDFGNTVGSKVATFATGILGGTATVSNVAASRVAEVKAGTNIASLTIDASAGGTGGTVKVDTGSATTVTVNGNASNDTYDIALGAAVTNLILDGNGTAAEAGTTDSFTVTLSGNTLNLTAGNTSAEIENLTLKSSGAANTLTLQNAPNLLVGTATGNKAVISGDKNLTIKGDLGQVNGITLEDSGTGVSTFTTNAALTAATYDLSKAAFDVVNIANAFTANNTVTVNENSTIKLSADTGNFQRTFNVNNVAGTLSATNQGALSIDLAAGSAANTIVAGTNVGTLKLSTASASAALTVNALDITNTSATTLAGAKDLTITTLTGGTDDVFTATGFTGKLTVGNTSNHKLVVIGGSGNDSLTVTAAAAGTVVRGGDGNDTIVGATAASSLFGDAGNDTITGAAGADTIDGGAGDDSLSGGAANDTITGGDGNDIIVGGAGADSLTGGAGNDVFQFVNTSTGVGEVQTIDLGTSTRTDGDITVGGVTVAVLAADTATETAGKIAAALHGQTIQGGAVSASSGGTVVTVVFATATGDATPLVVANDTSTITGTVTVAETTKGVAAVAAADSNATDMDVITDWAAGDKIDLSINMSLDTTAVTGTTSAAALSTNGLISFASLSAANQPTSLANALTLVAAAVAGGNSTAAGEAAVFVYDNAAYLYVSDGTGTHSATTDTVIKLAGISSLSTGLTLFGGDVTGIA